MTEKSQKVQFLIDGETAVAADCDNESAASSDNETAVAAVWQGPLKHDVATNKMEEDIFPLDARQADDVTQSQLQVSALQISIEACRETGLLKAVQTLELEISKLRRRSVQATTIGRGTGILGNAASSAAGKRPKKRSADSNRGESTSTR